MRKLTQNEWIGIVVALAVLALFVTRFSSVIFPAAVPASNPVSNGTSLDGSSAMASTTAPGQAAPTGASANAATSVGSLPTPQANQILIHDLVVGTGTEAVAGKTLTMDYVGTLQNGTQFDSSASHGQPFSFTHGAGQVIKGWDEGITGMKVGGVRILIIPPDLGYGSSTVGTIPPNSVLIFEVRLDSVN